MEFKPKIIIVDDHPLFREGLKLLIEMEGLGQVIAAAENGQVFLDLLKVMDPDLVLMDIEMPVMDGIEAVTIAKEIYPDVHFLMLTVFDDDEKLFEAIKAGASGYLLKDEKVANIVMAITEIIYEGGYLCRPE